MPLVHWFRPFAALLLVALVPLAGRAALVSIGPDSDPVFPAPRVLNLLSATAPVTATPLATLGNGSVGFNGGLAYDSVGSQLFAVGNDSLGVSGLYRMDSNGAGLAAVGAGLGFGFTGGLAYHAGNDKLYAIGSDFGGASTLFEIDKLSGLAAMVGAGPIGFGFQGGLTYNADNGKLYAIAGDLFGAQRQLVEIDATTGLTAILFSLGDGSVSFQGGLAYDDAADLFHVIGNDFGVNSTLHTFTLGGGAASLGAVGTSFGQGFVNVGLAHVPAVVPPSPVPEPPALELALLGLWLARRTAAGRSKNPSGRSSRRAGQP